MAWRHRRRLGSLLLGLLAASAVGIGRSAATVALAADDPINGFHVQLVWDTDQTDLDLHLLDDIGTSDRFNPNGWFNPVKDCSYLNQHPDWGSPGDPLDDPHLDIDDVSGFGPEVTSIRSPASGEYTMGVHYFCDKRVGPTRATVRVFCDGALASEFTRELSGSGDFWEVGTVTFPGCIVREVGTVTRVAQGCQVGEPPAVRITVVDERTGAPVPGATVLVEPTGTVMTTDANGVVQVQAAGPLSVHAFKAEYTWLSIVGTSATDILMPLPPKRNEMQAGGFKGTFDFSVLQNSGDVGFGLAGASIPGSFVDLDFSKVIGPAYRYHVKIGNLFDDFLSLPSGLVLTLSDQAIKGDYQALADPGLRHAWGIGGKISFEKLIQVLTPILGGGSSGENIPFGQVISQLVPLFETFLHFVQSDIPVVEVPTVSDVHDINGNGSFTDLVPDFQNSTGFPTVTVRPDQPLGLSASVVVPPLPPSNSGALDSVIVLAGADVKGRGFLPLGFGAAANAPGTINFKMSPLHGGLEGKKFVFETLATSTAMPASRVSGIITHADTVDQTPIQLPNFLGFPEASYDPITRTFFLGRTVPGAAFYRTDFRGPQGDWTIYFAPPLPPGFSAFVLPPSPIGGDRADFGSTIRLASIATQPCFGNGAPGLNAISMSGAINLMTLNDCLGAFSNTAVQAMGPPPPPGPQLHVLKRVEDINGPPVVAGDELRYTVEMSNVGSLDVTGVVAVDRLPETVALVTADRVCTVDGSQLTCPVGTLPASTTIQLQFTVRVAEQVPPRAVVSNQAVVTARELATPVLSDDPATPAPADPTIVVVSGPAPLLPPSMPDLPDEFDTGVSAVDNLTNIATPSFVGTAAPNHQVLLLIDDRTAVMTAADDAGRWIANLSAPLPDGVYRVTAVAINAAGIRSAQSPALTLSIDTTPPAVACPVPLTILEEASGFAVTPDFQRDVIRYEPLTLTQEPLKGTPIAAGRYGVLMTAADMAGNTSRCTAALTVLDNTPPALVSPAVVQRGRLGNLTRDVTFIPTGPFASHIAILDGYEVLGVAAAGRGNSAIHKLFDVRGLPIEHGPEGFAYIESEHLFAMVDSVEPTKLFLSDHFGRLQGLRTISYLNGPPDFVDGLAYIPETSAQYADHLAIIFGRSAADSVAYGLAIMRRDGTVVSELLLPAMDGSAVSFIGIAYAAPDRLLVSTSRNEIWTLDFARHLLAGPVPGPHGDVESMVQLPDRRIAAVNRYGGKLFFFDERLQRLSDQDRSYAVGVGVSPLVGLAWNPDDGRHLASHLELSAEDVSARTVVTSISPSLDSARRILEETGSNAGGLLLNHGMTYLPDEHLIALAVGRGGRPSVLLYDRSGDFVEGLSIPAFDSVPGIRESRQPAAIDYIPGLREFAVVTRQEPMRLHFVSRTGTLLRTIDFAAAGVDQIRAIAFFKEDASGGDRLMIVDSPVTDRVLLADINGQPLATFNYRAALDVLSVRDAATITSGPQAGTFSVVDPGNSELVVFGVR